MEPSAVDGSMPVCIEAAQALIKPVVRLVSLPGVSGSQRVGFTRLRDGRVCMLVSCGVARIGHQERMRVSKTLTVLVAIVVLGTLSSGVKRILLPTQSMQIWR